MIPKIQRYGDEFNIKKYYLNVLKYLMLKNTNSSTQFYFVQFFFTLIVS